MSLILEALRKSEAERRRGLAPDVAMELPPSPTSRPRAMATWLLPALIVTALLVLAVWWSRRELTNAASTTTATTEVTAETPELTPEVLPAQPQVVPRIEPSQAIVASTAAPDKPAMTQPTPTPAPAATSPTAPAPAIPRATPMMPTPIPSQPAPIQLPPRPLPTPSGDISSDTSMLPPVKLSMLMWDDVPSKRFVILNGQRMAEGDRYGAISVIAIERGGVVVEGNGAKARVPLP